MVRLIYIHILIIYITRSKRVGKEICLFYSSTSEKKVFSFFSLTPSQMWLKRPVYRGFKGEGKCEGKLSPLTLTLTLPAGKYPVSDSMDE